VNANLKERPHDDPVLILVVEDEPIIREFVCEMLQLEGYATEAVENADLALEILNDRAEVVKLLLTDIRMPGSMDGAGLSNVTHDKWPGIPILVMSGHETPESSGVIHPVTFLRKPWTIGQMLDGVEHALGVKAG
jgi:DNA-binding NtrC family response regulator